MTSNYDNNFDMEGIASFLKDAVEKVKTEENPDLLNEFKKVYKKNVPFSLRMYVAAYLTKQAQQGHKYTARNRRDGANQKQYQSRIKKTYHAQETTASNETSAHSSKTPHVKIDENLATTIFIGIGRNRRVYPRDLVGLISSVTEIDRERIGEIRVLANYSFVQLFTEDAQKVIDSLDGYDYRGRKISVSYSRKKDETASSDSRGQVQKKTPETKKSAATENSMLSKEDAKAYAAAEKAAANREPFGTATDDD